MAMVEGGKDRNDTSGGRWEYTPEAYATFPRYLVLEAILNEVERLSITSFQDIDAMRAALIKAGNEGETLLSGNDALPSAAQNVMQEERSLFGKFVSETPAQVACCMVPLPYRRVFSAEELKAKWARLDRDWHTSGPYWWPLRTDASPFLVLAFHTDYFDAEKRAALKETLLGMGCSRVFELRYSIGVEIEVESFDPMYNGEEGYWTPPSFEWLIYASHESSIAIAGQELISRLKAVLPHCELVQYRGPFSTTDRRGCW